MTLDRHMARLLAAVIVMIAASFGVSVAQAHEGHRHHHPATTASAQTTSPAPAVAKIQSASVRAEKMIVAHTVMPAGLNSIGTHLMIIAALASEDMPNDCGGCNGVCCSMGMACCHSALTPASLVGVPALTLATTVVAPQDVLRPSLVPEALPKPPRAFAA